MPFTAIMADGLTGNENNHIIIIMTTTLPLAFASTQGWEWFYDESGKQGKDRLKKGHEVSRAAKPSRTWTWQNEKLFQATLGYRPSWLADQQGKHAYLLLPTVVAPLP